MNRWRSAPILGRCHVCTASRIEPPHDLQNRHLAATGDGRTAPVQGFTARIRVRRILTPSLHHPGRRPGEGSKMRKAAALIQMHREEIQQPFFVFDLGEGMHVHMAGTVQPPALLRLGGGGK